MLSLALSLTALSLSVALPAQTAASGAKVSYHKQIWPLIQAKCQGCHQPASAGGKLVVTTLAEFMKGGEHGVAIVPGQSDKSTLMLYLNGERTLMPKNGPALPPTDIALFKRWIQEGSKDDSPVQADPISAEHPPVYRAAPVVTALAYSPDGKTLAISGYREILLHHADGSGLIARLVGKSQKILSLAFTSDGATLCAVGGTPALFGEVQFWDTAKGLETNAVKTTFDTIFGASISPDNKQLAFGGADNSVRVVTVPDGKQVMQLDNHSDWVFATVFALDAKKQLHVLSAARDQAIKLTLVNGGSFIDDINTHYTALRCLARNPKADQVLCGGDDGIPRLYKIFRTEARTMNQEDHNLVKAYDKQAGAITAVAIAPDGMRLAIGSITGSINIYETATGKLVSVPKGVDGPVYAMAFSPDSLTLTAGGFDGVVRTYNTALGQLMHAFTPVPLMHSRQKDVVKGPAAKPHTASLR